MATPDPITDNLDGGLRLAVARPDVGISAQQIAFPRFWAKANVRTDKGIAFSEIDFSQRPWLEQIYDDTFVQKVIEKAAQLGLTTEALIEAIHRAAVWGDTVIYTMPTGADATLLVNDRLNKMIDTSPYLTRMLGRAGRSGDTSRPTDNTHLKSFASGGGVHFRGTIGKTAALSIPAQALYHDEVDASNPAKLEEYEDRLGGVEDPRLRRIVKLSTPTVADYGIDAAFNDGDMRRWLVRCSACNWEGELNYWTHTGGELLRLTCQCGATLDPRHGRFVAERPGRYVHSYKLSGGRLLLALPGPIGESELEFIHSRRKRTRFMRNFDNKVLGETSAEGVYQATLEQLKAALFNRPTYLASLGAETGAYPHFMGIDQGDTLTITIFRADPRRDEGHFRIVYFNRLRDPSKGSASWKEAGRLMEQFRIEMCVTDGMPNSSPAHDLAKDFPGRVLVCYYGDDMRTEVSVPAAVAKRASGQFQGDITTTERVDITVDRTQSLDNTITDLTGGKFWMPGPPSNPDIQEVLRHIVNNTRVPVGGDEDDSEQEPSFRWIRKGPNDYFHSLNYARIAESEYSRQRNLRPNSLALDLGISGVTPLR